MSLSKKAIDEFKVIYKSKYKKEIAEKYNLTEEQLSEISIEGVTKHWPMPKF